MKKRILSMVTALMFIIGISLPVNAADKKTVQVGFFEMKGFFEKDGDSYSGYGYEYIVEMAKHAKWNLEFVEGSFEELQYNIADDLTVDLMLGVYHYDEYDMYFDYSSLSVGTGCSLITAAADNGELSYEDYASLDGKRIGFLSDRYKCDEFAELAKEKGIGYTEVMYGSEKHLYQALKDGDVDAVVANDVVISGTEKLIGSFYYRNYYVITKKGNNVLMREINDALEEIERTKPSFSADLYEKYFAKAVDGTEISGVKDYLTAEEREYVINAPTLTVGISRYLSADAESGLDSCMASSVIDMYEAIAAQTGLDFKYVTVGNIGDAAEKLRSGEIDIIGAFPERISLADENGLTITGSFMTVRFCMVYQKNNVVGEHPTFSLVRGINCNELIIQNNPQSGLIYSDSYADAVTAVKNGNADVAVISRYIAEELLASSDFNNVYSVSSAYSENISCGLSKTGDPLLVSILNKSVSCFSANELDEIIEANRTPAATDFSIAAFIAAHPFLSIGFTAGFIIITAIPVLLLMKQHRLKKSNRIKDALTGLLNADGFAIMGQKLLDANPTESFILSSFNIKHFNFINSIYGAERGDDVLKHLARLLNSALSGNYIAARSNSDNFYVLYSSPGKNAADELAKKIQSELKKYEHARKENYTVEIYCGSVFVEIVRPRLSVSELAEQSLTAQISIKNKNLLNVFYSEDALGSVEKTRGIIRKFNEAIDNGEFRIYFQPKHRLKENGRVAGGEMLTRWVKPDGTTAYPDEYLEMMTNYSAIVKLDKYVYGQACGFIRENADKEWFRDFAVSINVSDVSALTPGFSEYCAMIKEQKNIPDNLIAFEFSEKVVFANEDVFRQLFASLHKNGFICSIDRFGSGNSSLTALTKIGADEIKLDRSLFSAFDEKTEKQNRIVIKSIISVAKAAGIKITAMGIDRPKQLDFLRENGCGCVQGYIYSKPFAVSDAAEYAEGFMP